jgi:hypothetical protein
MPVPMRRVRVRAVRSTPDKLPAALPEIKLHHGEAVADGAANYTYFHLMELALALTLRVYQVIPATVLTGVIRHRRSLYSHYRQAYTERRTGLGAPILIETADKATISLRGVFLDAGLNFTGGRLVSSGRPKVLSPFEALADVCDPR